MSNSAGRKMVEGLTHKFAWAGDDAKFFQSIDEHGGWPAGYQFVGFEHTDERAAGFCNSRQNTGWWTVIADADDYYLWKLSPAALQRVVDAAIAAARITQPAAATLWIRDSFGNRATVQKAPKASA